MVALVTGGAGFIGSHVVERLISAGMQVKVIDDFSTGRIANISHLGDRVQVIEADIGKHGSWMEEFSDVEYVYHLAALADIVPSIQKPEEYFNANVVGTFNVLNAIRGSGIRKFVYTASSSCYGLCDVFPTNEMCSLAPQYPYALTKRLGEELVMHWCSVYGIPSISLRLFNVYGTRSRTSGTYGAMFGVFLAQKLANKPLTVVGDGNQKRDFIYVTDVVDALVKAAECDLSGEIFNIGSGKPVSVNQIVELLQCETVHIPKRPGEPFCTHADVSKARSLLRWQPNISIDDGIKLLLANIDYWQEAIVWTPKSIEVETKEWFKYLGEGNDV